ncbi:MAG: DUF3021 domain-containing protein [Oscillospiraceae bacterium]|nr:DUF3021 domain-containing protein [Oscillospiraceae bacterium]
MKNYIVTGMGIGFPVTLGCMTLIGGYNGVIQEFLVWMIASALFGLMTWLAYTKLNELPLPAAMAVHCLGCLLVAVGAAWACGYSDSFLQLTLRVMPVFAVVYGVIYALCFFSMKNQEKRINAALEKE